MPIHRQPSLSTGGHFLVETGIGIRARKPPEAVPIVTVTADLLKTDMSPEDAEALALNLLQASAAAREDALSAEQYMEAGMTPQEIMSVLEDRKARRGR